MPRPFNDLTGQRFGRLTVVSRAENAKDGKLQWNCICDCGKKKIIRGENLRNKRSTSCGCFINEIIVKRNTKHGYKKDRLYQTWLDMLSRTDNINNKYYYNYGGRGIKVCNEWKSDYTAFKDWALSNGYSDYLTIERIDNNGNYTPNNCKWATKVEQENNKRSNRMVTYRGETKTLKQWSIFLDISYDVLCSRLKRGWSIEKALTTPLKKNK